VPKAIYKKLTRHKQRLQLRFIIAKDKQNAHLQVRKRQVLITAKLITYGNAASALMASQMAANIQRHWNFPKAKQYINGKYYTVVFTIKPLYYPNLTEEIIKQNRHLPHVFVRIETELSLGVSLMDNVGSNTGFFLDKNVGYKGASTEAHEFGHALGLWPNSETAHPKDLDQRGKGRPGIMYPRGTLVDAKFQYKPEVPAGADGGTVSPDYRRVRQEDIDVLFSTVLIAKDKRKWNFGKLSNKYHQAVWQR
jgi:hypothetical protein